MSEPSVSSLAIYQLRVELCGVSLLVWRRLLVVNETSLSELHKILQNAFDWSGEHLHRLFAFALLPFYLLKPQRSAPKIYSCTFVSIVLLISCSVRTAFGTLSCIKNVVFPQRLTQPLPSPPKISSNRSPYSPRIGLRPTAGCVVRVSP